MRVLMLILVLVLMSGFAWPQKADDMTNSAISSISSIPVCFRNNMLNCLCEKTTLDKCQARKNSLKDSMTACFIELFEETVYTTQPDNECAEDQATPVTGLEQYIRRLIPRYTKMINCVAALPGMEQFKKCLDKLWANRPAA
ncbi:hypothetical protein OTU49_000497 [Cherax quadricarinatus]|uniref:Uncharacterized protein n=1 Tax=Cherax quadricarinatus TaxID=27406 RepID=A0AAW0XMU0_CHEQU